MDRLPDIYPWVARGEIPEAVRQRAAKIDDRSRQNSAYRLGCEKEDRHRCIAFDLRCPFSFYLL